MRSIGREIASSSLKKPARGTSGISVYVKTSHSYIVSFHPHTCCVCVYIYVSPWFIFYQRLSSTLLPFSWLTFLVGCHPICRHRSNHLSLRLYSCLCVCVGVCASSYNSAQICFNMSRHEILGISRRVKLNTSPNMVTITRSTLTNA